MAETIAIWLITTFSAANAAGAVVVSMATLNAVTAVVSAIAITGAHMAVNKLLAPKMPSFSDPSLTDRNQMVRSPIAARQVIYGRAKVSGVIVYVSTTGTKNEYLHLVIALAGHQVEEIGDIYFNDELALTGAGSAAQGRFIGYADIYKKLGSDTQTVETNLEAATSGLTNGKWTSNHRLRGIAYIYVRLKWNDQIWQGGIPSVSAIVKGKQVYDPRTATTAYSANAALCLRDYLTNSTYGLGMTSSEVDDTAFSVAANICDEQVEIKPVTIPATYENRYECNGVLFTSASPDDNIGKLLTAMGGLVAYSGGKIVPYAAGYRIPTVTLTDTDFVGGINVQTKASARDRVNAVKGVYVSEKNDWQASDFPPSVSATYLSQDNNVRYWRDVALPFTTSSSCAQRLARIELRRARQEITLTCKFRLDAMQVRAGDTVMVTLDRFGWTSKVFEVIEWHFVSDGEPPQLQIEMTLRETASSVYDWSVTDEEAVANASATTLPNPYSITAPKNLTLTADGTTQLIQADGTAIPRIKVAWSAPSDDFVQSGGDVVIEYKQGNSTTYLTWSRLDGDQTLDYISSDVRIGTTYDVRIYGLSFFGITSSLVTASVTVAKDTTAPATPTNLAITTANGIALSLDWDDNTEADFSEYGVYRNTTGVTPANASTNQIAQTRSSRFVDTEVVVGTRYYYWVNAYDTVENVSGFSSGVSATATSVSGTLNTTAPSTPSAPTYSSETIYLASDGTALGRITLNIPTMPTGGQVMHVLYRISGTTYWQIAVVLDAGGGVYTVDDLSVGIAYDFAVRAFSYYNIASAISATITRTVSNPAAPSAPTISYVSGESSAPVQQGKIPMYSIAVSATAPSETDAASLEIKIVSINSSSSISYSWYAEGNVGLYAVTIKAGQAITVPFYSVNPAQAGYCFARIIGRSGVASSWASLGNVTSSPSFIKLPIGTISQYDYNDVTTTGIKTGSGSSTRQVNVRYETSSVFTLAGGGSTSMHTLDITNAGFSAKPDSGQVQALDTAYAGFYDYDNASNSSTTVYIKISRFDGGTVVTGPLRVNILLVDYT